MPTDGIFIVSVFIVFMSPETAAKTRKIEIFDARSGHATFMWADEFRERGLLEDYHIYECLCSHERYGLDYPPADVVLVNPNYESPECLRSVGAIIRQNPETRFYVSVLTFTPNTLQKVHAAIGNLPNLTYLDSKLENGQSSYYITMKNLLDTGLAV